MNMPTVKLETASGDVQIPNWLWTSVGTVLLLIVGGLGTWVGATIFDHEVRIVKNETRISAIDLSINRIEAGVERLNLKIDRLLEANQQAVLIRPHPTETLMAGFKYYFPGVAPEQMQGPLRGDFLAKRNLARELGGLVVPNSATANQLQKGPDDGVGMLLTPKSAADPDQSVIYKPKQQHWLKSTAGEVWIGWEDATPPTPADLARPVLVGGRPVKDSSGQEWTIPTARYAADDFGQLPQQYTFDAAGEPVPHLREEYRELWDRSGDLWDFYAQQFAESAAAAGEEIPVPEFREHWTHRWLLEQAVYLLGVNYRVGILEINALFEANLGVLDGTVSHAFCQAALDFALLRDAQKKTKTAASSAGPPARGSKSTPGEEADSPDTSPAAPPSSSPA